MRKTSQDGGDTSSITSGVENEIKRSAAGLVKSKKSSIKRKVQSFSHESDDGVVEPLLQKEKEKTVEKSESLTQGAKYLLSKTKTDIKNGKTDDRDMLLCQEKLENPSITSVAGITDDVINSANGNYKTYGLGATTVHNHMNVNVFGSPHGLKNVPNTKSQMLVEINGSNPGSYNSGPLIFTTAKIHSDGKKTHMEPVQVTPVPILSTVEGTVIKTSSFVGNKMKNIETMPMKIENKKTELLENNLKGLIITSTSTPPVIPVVSNNVIDTERLQSDMTKTCSTPTSALRDVKTQNDNLVKPMQTFDLSTETDQNRTFSSFYVKDDCKVQKPLISINTDVNKNFESSSSDSNQPDLAKTQVNDKNSKIDNATGSKQLQRQKNTSDDRDGFSGKANTQNVNINTNTQTKEDTKSKLIQTTETNIVKKGDPDKTHSPINSMSTNVPTKSATPNDKATKIFSLEYGATATTSSKILPVSKSDKATPSSFATGITSSNTKSTVATANQKENANMSIDLQTKPTSIPVSIGNTLINEPLHVHPTALKSSEETCIKPTTIPLLPSKIPIGISSTESSEKNVQSIVSKEEQTKTRPASTIQTDKAVLKIKPITTSSHQTPITKTMPTITTSRQSTSATVSKPDALTSSNTANSSVSNSKNNEIKSIIANTTSQKNASKINNSTSVSSQSVPSVLPSMKPVSTSVGKTSDPTVSSQVSATVNKPTTSKKFTAHDMKPNVSGTATKLTHSSTKTNSTQAATNVVSIKSPTAPVPSSSTQKSSVVQNKNQSQRSDLKKDKFK